MHLNNTFDFFDTLFIYLFSSCLLQYVFIKNQSTATVQSVPNSLILAVPYISRQDREN